MNILVLGAGAWGTALAVSAAAQEGGFRQVSLWARDAQQADDMRIQRENRRYLPGVALPPSLAMLGGAIGGGAGELRAADLVIIGTPMAGLRGLLGQLVDHPAPVVWLCKGFEAPRGAAHAGGLLGHEIRAEVAPRLKGGVLSGPSFAQEVARGQPTALVAASEHACVREMLVAAFHSPALVTRGLAEMTRLGMALGARADTFMGLSGLGDLVLTATGDLSRNRKVGQLLAQGMNLQQAVDSLGHVAEGVYSARTVVQRARLLGVDMPISEGVVALLEGRLQPAQAVAELMGRDPKQEAL